MITSVDELTRQCSSTRNALRSGQPPTGPARDIVGDIGLSYLALARRGLRYVSRSEDLAPAEMSDVLAAEGAWLGESDVRQQQIRMRLALLSNRPLLSRPHPDAVLALNHLRTVLFLLPVLAPPLLSDSLLPAKLPSASGLRSPRGAAEVLLRLDEMETTLSRLVAGEWWRGPDLRRTYAYFEVAAHDVDVLRQVVS